MNSYCVGIGKTTMAHELCSRWAKAHEHSRWAKDEFLAEDEFLAKDFDAVILIRLRSLQHRSLENMIKTQIGKSNYERLEELAGKRCLIILEGLDEVSFDHRKSDQFFKSLVKECDVLQEARVVITSRPHACKDIDAGRKVEVIGFGKDEIREFVEKSFPNDTQSSEDFLRQLNDYPQLHSLCYIPLNLVIILRVYNHDGEKKLPSTLTELYQAFIVMTMKREVKKENVKNKPVCLELTEMAKAGRIKEILSGIPEETVGIVLRLCELAHQSFFETEDEYGRGVKKNNPSIIFSKSDLTQCKIEVTDNFDGFGLLKVMKAQQLSTDINTYNFNHLTIQEFLCAVYISSLTQQEQLCLLREHFDDYPNVFIFVCGLTGSASSEMFLFIYSKLTSYCNVITAIRCISESKQSSTAHQLVSPFALIMSGWSLLPYDCLCVSNILSHYPVTKLDMKNCGISDKGAEMFMKHCINKTTTCQLLEELHLSNNELTSEGMKHMVKVVKTSKTHYYLLIHLLCVRELTTPH